MEGRWCSAAEVAADVSRAGGGVAPPAPLAGACLAWGARPAPLILTEPSRTPAHAPPERAAPPDLRGISQMLRMVQIEDTDEDSSAPGDDMVISKLGDPSAPAPAPPHRPQSTPSGGARTQQLINNECTLGLSQLNPNVAEFVPRSERGGGGREELAARLRDDISGGGRDRCSAIARLMRLYAEPAHAPAPAPAQRLLTPDYFERAATAPVSDRPTDGNSSPTTETASERIQSVGSHCISPMSSVRQPEGATVHPDDVRVSVDKVRRWLGEPARASPRASPRLLLTPVKFRARAPPAHTPPPPPHAPPATRAYSPPPDAAAALHREYLARAAAAPAAPAPPCAAPPPPAGRARDTLWSRVEATLRRKEAEQRARDEP